MTFAGAESRKKGLEYSVLLIRTKPNIAVPGGFGDGFSTFSPGVAGKSQMGRGVRGGLFGIESRCWTWRVAHAEKSGTPWKSSLPWVRSTRERLERSASGWAREARLVWCVTWS